MKIIKLFILAISLLVTGMLAAQPLTSLAQNIACYRSQGGAKNVAASGCEFEFQSGSTLDLQSGTTITHDDVTVSGPVRFGTASNVITGTTIAHGVGTTPTAVLLTPEFSGVYTPVVYVLSTDATSITVGLEDASPGGAITVTTLHWLAGK